MLARLRRSTFRVIARDRGADRQTMGLIEELRFGAQKATDHARVSVHEAELGRDLADAYSELGRNTFALMQTGALRDRTLAPLAKRVGELEARLFALEGPKGGDHTT